MRSGASVCPASRCGMRAPRARMEVRGSCVDAPVDASISSEGSGHAVECFRVSGLSMRHARAAGPYVDAPGLDPAIQCLPGDGSGDARNR